MKIADFKRMIDFVYSLTSIGSSDLNQNVCGNHEQKNLVTPLGGNYDIYLPNSKTHVTVIALHGTTVNGKEDSRLIQFSRALASSGIGCIVPNLFHLANGGFCSEDLDFIKELILLNSQDESSELGLVGFSLGGSYALTAAVDEALATKISFVTTFGACYSISDFFKPFVDGNSQPENDLEWDKYIHMALLGIHRFHKKLEISTEVVNECEELLKDYCVLETIARKRQLFLNKLATYEPVKLYCQEALSGELSMFSPEGKLAGIKCRASLIHGTNDHLISAHNTKKIFTELVSAGNFYKSRILITDLLGHVHPGKIRLFEGLQFLKSIKLMFE